MARACLIVFLLTSALCFAQSSAYGPLPDGLQLPAVLKDNINSANLHVGDTVRFRLSNNLLGPGGVVAIPKDATLLGRVDVVALETDNTWRVRVTVHHAEWQGGSLALHAFAVAVKRPQRSVELASIPLMFVGDKTGHTVARTWNEAVSGADPAVDLRSNAKALILEKETQVALRQTTRADFKLATSGEQPAATDTRIPVTLRSFLDVRKCKVGEAVKFEIAGHMRTNGEEVVLPANTEFVGKVVECVPHTATTDARLGVQVESVVMNKTTLPVLFNMEPANSQPAPGGRIERPGRSFQSVIVIENGSVSAPAAVRMPTEVVGASLPNTSDNPFAEVECHPGSKPGEPSLLVSKTRNFYFSPGLRFILRQVK